MNKKTMRVWPTAAGLMLAAMLAACGGGGGGGATGGSGPVVQPPAGTPIPTTLAIQLPATASAGASVKFASSTEALSGLSYAWDFGDGSKSAETSPSHSYVRGGDFKVLLKVSNATGDSREVQATLSINTLANVSGLNCSGANNSGWCVQTSMTGASIPLNVSFIDASTGWRVGSLGAVAKTTDGGATWTSQNSGTTGYLRSAAFANAQNGWILYGDASVIKTRDGGTTWSSSTVPAACSSATAFSISAPGADTAYLMAAANVPSCVTTDAGLSWRALSPAPQLMSDTGLLWYYDAATRKVSKSSDAGLTRTQVLDLGSVDATVSMASGGGESLTLLVKEANNFRFFRTADGGANWTLVSDPSEPASPYPIVGNLALMASSSDGKNLFGVSYTRPAQSTDYGKTWRLYGTDLYTDPQLNIPTQLVVLVNGSTLALQDRYWPAYDGPFYPTPRAARVSRDAGGTWSDLAAPDGGPSYWGNISLKGPVSLWLTASDGTVHQTRDGGAHWVKVGLIDNADAARSSSFSDALHGITVTNRTLSETKDGGRSWTVRRVGEKTSVGTAYRPIVQLANAQVGWLIEQTILYKTTDGGATWTLKPAPGLADFTFFDAQLGVGKVNSGYWVVSKDGGDNWTRIEGLGALFNTRKILFADATRWAAVAEDGKHLFTKDAGATWQAAAAGNSAGTAVAGLPTLWIGAGYTSAAILQSNDGGEHWATIQVGPAYSTVRDIKFFDAQRGWLVGDSGLLMATTDGGKTWVTQPNSGQQGYGEISIVDAKTIWISGASGALLVTATGGF
ncbi:YCF48-related protein [Pelomonas sp. SE-A7]|uniref:YCF48-related protein n=1 Tax=Pelomonas sp. SE-A7 TaxID=3054953 RepID=UPI00259D0BE4|nr:YCF48-related protein [Pelomonas sp. SE-A7]MDM4766999.1 YCF48-related protein [Pelomonas sp. SE-A7]